MIKAKWLIGVGIYGIVLVSCKTGSEQLPHNRVVSFSSPSASSFKINNTQMNENPDFELTMDVITTDNNNNAVDYEGSPIFLEDTNAFQPQTTYIQIKQPQGATFYLVKLDLRINECGFPIHGVTVTNPEKGAKAKYRHISPSMSYPNDYYVQPNQLAVYHSTQCN